MIHFEFHHNPTRSSEGGSKLVFSGRSKCTRFTLTYNQNRKGTYYIISILGGEDVINSDDETHFTQNPTDCPQYAPGGDEFVKCRVTRDKRGLDVLGEFDLT